LHAGKIDLLQCAGVQADAFCCGQMLQKKSRRIATVSIASLPPTAMLSSPVSFKVCESVRSDIINPRGMGQGKS